MYFNIILVENKPCCVYFKGKIIEIRLGFSKFYVYFIVAILVFIDIKSKKKE